MAKRNPTDKFTTPAGTLKGFISLEVPSQKYDTYSATLLIEGEAGDKIKEYIDKLVSYNSKVKNIKGTYNPCTKTDAGVELKLKNKANFTTKKGDLIDCKPGIWDTDNKKVEELLNIGEGTSCIVQIEPYLWATSNTAGVTLQPKNIQILELVKYKGSESSSPFDKVDGAYKANKDGVFDDDSLDSDFEDAAVEFDDDDDVPF